MIEEIIKYIDSEIKKVHDECGNYQKDEYENGKLNTLENLKKEVKEIDLQHNVIGRSELLFCDCQKPSIIWINESNDMIEICHTCQKYIAK